MKYLIALLLTTIILVFGCNTATRSDFFSPESLVAEKFSINTNRDTTLQTKSGALIQILKGALSVDGGIAKLEIKEAYSIQQMIKAGLSTNSNGEPLSSGGMIYINAAGGQKITFNQPVKVAIPADHLEKGMQLFKGEKDNNGNINWTSPVPLPGNKQLTAIESGKILFQQKCGSCHGIGTVVTAHDLAHILKRFPFGELNAAYLRHGFTFSFQSRDELINHYEVYKDSCPKEFLYKCNLIKGFGDGPALQSDSSNISLLEVYRYIQNESDRLNLKLPDQVYLNDCIDSCMAVVKRIIELRAEKDRMKQKRNELVKENSKMVERKDTNTSPRPNVSVPVAPATSPNPNINYDETVSPENLKSEYYQFTIESFGWFNIDILLKDLPGIQPGELLVRIRGEFRKKVQVLLIIPSLKVNIEGGRTGKAEDEFAFNTKDGKIPLPQNTKAYILAITEASGNIAFALREFTTTTQQQVEISLQQATMEEFNSAIMNLGLDGMNIKVAKSKNADEIRKNDLKAEEIDKEIKKAEERKPKGCNCDCFTPNPITKVAPGIESVNEGIQQKPAPESPE